MTAALWRVFQIGAREHYALARALHERGLLDEFVTDVWARPSSVWARFPGIAGERLRGRFEPALVDAQVRHFTGAFARFEIGNALAHSGGKWDVVLRRNELFQRLAVRRGGSRRGAGESGAERPIVFAYAYAARQIFEAAENKVAVKVLGQIDGGLVDQNRVGAIAQQQTGCSAAADAPPKSYWENWTAERRLADVIVVNSPWSRDLLIQAGTPTEKVVVVPLIYEPSVEAEETPRSPAVAFDRARPLRVLFLGSLVRRKGVVEALGAARELCGEPAEFAFVGIDPEGHAEEARTVPNVRWSPAVPRAEVGAWYRWADVFLFPTHSDGFGLTQLEAQEWGAPVIASKNCGEVVEPGRNGFLVEEVSAGALAAAIRKVLSESFGASGDGRRRARHSAPLHCGRDRRPALLRHRIRELAQLSAIQAAPADRLALTRRKRATNASLAIIPGLASVAVGTIVAVALVPDDYTPAGALFWPGAAMAASFVAPVALRLRRDLTVTLRVENLLLLGLIYWLLLDLLQSAYPIEIARLEDVRTAFWSIGIFAFALWLARGRRMEVAAGRARRLRDAARREDDRRRDRDFLCDRDAEIRRSERLQPDRDVQRRAVDALGGAVGPRAVRRRRRISRSSCLFWLPSSVALRVASAASGLVEPRDRRRRRLDLGHDSV